MIWIGRTALIGTTALLMVSFLPTLFGRIPIPNLILIAILWTSFARQWSVSLMWATLGGLVLDIFTPGHGFFMLFFVILAASTRLLLGRSDGRAPATSLVLIMITASSLLPLLEIMIAGEKIINIQLLLAILANLIGLAIGSAFQYVGRRKGTYA